MRILIIANPNVGIDKAKRAILDKIASCIHSSGGSTDIMYTVNPGLGRMHSSRASLEGYSAVYAAGGDGTINEVASGLMGHSIPLGIIPLGTGNGFARSLNIPLDSEGIIKVLMKNKITTIDTGIIESHIFLATAGIGYDAQIAHDFNLHRNAGTGLPNYFFLAVKNYFFKRSEKLTLILDGREMNRKVFALTVCNTSQYGGGAIIAPQAGPKSGELLAVLVPRLTPYKAIPAVKKLFNGTVNECRELEYIPFKTLTIKRRQVGLYHFDGETSGGGSTLKISVNPSSLNVIIP